MAVPKKQKSRRLVRIKKQLKVFSNFDKLKNSSCSRNYKVTIKVSF